MKPWNNPVIVGRSTMMATGLLEVANVSQLIQMWTTWTAAGQSIPGWLCVQGALWIFLNFYRVCVPNEKFAFWGTVVGICMNNAVILTVLYFRYVVGQ